MSDHARFEAGVVGAGAWGTTIASHLANRGHSTLLWAFEEEVAGEINSNHRNSVYLHDINLPDGLSATTELADMSAAKYLFVMVPSGFYKRTVEDLSKYIDDSIPILSATKGFVSDELARPSEFLAEMCPGHSIGVLSGPNLAREIAHGLPAISLVASHDEKLVQSFQSLLSTERFRVYGGTDMIGTELGGALKNIMAIAAGMVDGLNLGKNTHAALITRGLAEMIRLGEELGARTKTFYGVSGLGDLVCTAQSTLSRNHQVGNRIAKGEKLEDILSASRAVAEGIDTTRHVQAYSIKNGIDLPITDAVYKVLFKGADPFEALKDLMTRALKME